MVKSERRILGAGLLALVLAPSVLADELTLVNGSRLVGKLVSAGDGKLVFDVEYVGTVEVDAAGVQKLVTDNPVTVLLNDGQVLADRRVESDNGGMLLTAPAADPVPLQLQDIDVLNPEPWQLGIGYRWQGNASAAMMAERGNTDTDELDLALRTNWESDDDRYTLNGGWEVDEANGDKNKDTWNILGKYDRFIEGSDTYYGALLGLESDEFADLDLRTRVGPYLGRQFLDTPLLDVRGEIGVVYVDEQFDVAEDDDYPGANWSFELSSDVLADLLGPETTTYLRHQGLMDLTEPDNLILDTTFGIGTPLYGGLQAAVEIVVDYDGGAVEGVKKTDQKYNFRLGYDW